MKTYLVIGFDEADGLTMWLKIKARGPKAAAESFVRQCRQEIDPKGKYFVEFVIGQRLEVHYQY